MEKEGKRNRWLAAFLGFALVMGTLSADESSPKKKNLLADAGIVAAVTFTYVLIIPSVRHNVFHHWSLGRVWDNFADPIRRAVEGGREDHNSFWINYVGHPLSFAALGLYLKDRGYGNTGALLFTQAQNIFWEYIVEGGVWKPSGKDLISDLAGSLFGIYILNPLSDLGERRIKEGDRRWGNFLLYWLNPFKKVNRLIFGAGENSPTIVFWPTPGGASLTLMLKPRF